MFDTDAAYLAGLIDGEGCLYVKPLTAFPRLYHFGGLSVTNTHLATLTWLKERFGGNIRIKARTGNQIPCGEWSIHGADAIRSLLKRLLPYLRIKKEQAVLLLEFLGDRQANSSARITDDDIAIREGYRLALQEAKR